MNSFGLKYCLGSFKENNEKHQRRERNLFLTTFSQVTYKILVQDLSKFRKCQCVQIGAMTNCQCGHVSKKSLTSLSKIILFKKCWWNTRKLLKEELLVLYRIFCSITVQLYTFFTRVAVNNFLNKLKTPRMNLWPTIIIWITTFNEA